MTDRDANPVRVVVIPDSFKGSATAAEVATAIAVGVRTAAGERPVEVTTIPFADGGEGTLEALLSAWDEPARQLQTVDAIGRPVTARYGISPDGSLGVVEAAESNGLPQVSDVPLQPLTASTRGVGTIVQAVLDAGVQEILLCLGGSATTDGGAGLVAALGARLLDADGRDVPPGGGGLSEVVTLDLDGLDPRAGTVRWRIACDVTNPLLGPKGAAAVFGPQKGAGPDDIAVLDQGLSTLAEVLRAASGVDVTDVPGMGAAGGMAATLCALFDAQLQPGAELVAEALGVEPLLQSADLVITGEGRLDEQSLAGKVVDAVRRMTPASTPVVVLAGEVAVDAVALRAAGISAAVSIAPGPRTLEQLRKDVHHELTRSAAAVAGLMLDLTR